jgi:hypothetical protein
MYIKFYAENLNGRHHLVDQVVEYNFFHSTVHLTNKH